MAAETTGFDEMIKAVQELPKSWGPRRNQPEWDRDFGGLADSQFHFANRTDTAHMWLAFCLGFSDTLIGGYGGLDKVREVGAGTLKAFVPKGKNQFDA